MGVRPYRVYPPFLEGEPDPEINYFGAIEDFAKARFVRLARRVITQMQRMSASGIFSDETRGVKSIWDEWCWYQVKYDNDCGLLSHGFEETLSSIIDGLVQQIEYSEAVLLSCAASDNQKHMPCRSDDEISAVVRRLVANAAAARSIDRFEVE